MSADPHRERLDELLADRALVGLVPAEEAELARLAAETSVGETNADERGELELAAAALDLALAPARAELPATLRARLDGAARRFRAPVSALAPRPVHPLAPRGRLASFAGWVVAAAAGLLAFLAWRAHAPAAPAPAELRAELLASAETLRRDWSATELAAGASGDVAWSQARQAGVVRIKDLAANDPTREQYQLWIFDDAQQYPIDGGVFDVRGGEVLIPIDAKLHVEKPKLFAVTREEPGGVVVSDKQRIVLVASL